MNILVRHARDKKGKYAHDERLSSDAKEDIEKFTEKMVEEYGFPDLIYYSPMLRTRSTTKYILKILKKIKPDIYVKIKCEPNLGRFFTSRERKKPDLHSSTMRRNAIIDNSKKEFHSRIKKHLRKVQYKSEKLNINIWNITHTLVLLHVAQTLNIDRNPHVEYLDFVKF
jgi:broad specificity phosphatase PhoE